MSSDSFTAIRTVFWGVLWRVLRCPFIFLSMIIIPKVMGVNLYGRFAFFVSIAMACEAFTGLGYMHIFGRFVPEFGPEKDENAAHFLHGLLRYGMILAFVIFCVATVVLTLARPPGYELRWTIILGAALLLGKFQDTLFFFLYGQNEIGRFSSRDLLRTVFKLLFVLALFPLFELEGALWAHALTHLALAVAGIWWTRRYLFRIPSRRFPFFQFKRYLLFGITFYIPTLLLSVLQQTGNIQIQTLTHSPEQVSYFDIANQFLLLGGTLLGLVITMLIPSLTPLHLNNKRDSVREWQGIVLSYCTAAAFLALNALILVGRLVITWLISPAFEKGYIVAVIAATALFPLLFNRVGANLALLRKEPWIYAASVFVGVLTMVGMGFFLIPRLGAVGAAWATVAAHLAMAVLFYIVYRDDLLGILKKSALTLVAGIVVMPFYLRDWSPPFRFVILVSTSLIYVMILLRFGIVTTSHVHKLFEALRMSARRV